MYIQTDKQTKEAYIASILVRNISANKFWARTKTFLTCTKVPRMARKGGLLRMLK